MSGTAGARRVPPHSKVGLVILNQVGPADADLVSASHATAAACAQRINHRPPGASATHVGVGRRVCAGTAATWPR